MRFLGQVAVRDGLLSSFLLRLHDGQGLVAREDQGCVPTAGNPADGATLRARQGRWARVGRHHQSEIRPTRKRHRLHGLAFLGGGSQQRGQHLRHPEAWTSAKHLEPSWSAKYS